MDRLLHPWQRDLAKLRDLNQRHRNGENVLGGDDDDEEQEQEEIGERGEEGDDKYSQPFRSNIIRGTGGIQKSVSEKGE